VILPSRSDLQKILAKFSTARIWLSSGETLGCPFPKHFPSLVAETDDQMGSIFVWKNRKICRKTLESGKKGSPVPECSSRDFKKFVWCHTKKIFFVWHPIQIWLGTIEIFLTGPKKGMTGSALNLCLHIIDRGMTGSQIPYGDGFRPEPDMPFFSKKSLNPCKKRHVRFRSEPVSIWDLAACHTPVDNMQTQVQG
jgi:hypothetical protein